MSTQSGRYYKIGSLYHVNITIVWTGKGSASAGSQIKISLPATVAAEGGASIGFASGIGFSGSYLTAAATSNVILLFGWSNAGGGANVNVSNLGTSGEIIVSATFWTV